MERWARTTAPPHPGPLDDSVLYLQSEHRSSAIFQGTGVDLDVRRCDKRFFLPLIHLDERVAQYIDAAGFYGIRRAGYLTVDHGLINALVERWRQETHTFHLPVMGEATVTLQDVEVLWGLSVDGLPVTLVQTKRSPLDRKQLVYDLLGYWPEDNMLNHGRLKLSSISRRLSTPLPADASDEMVRQYARMNILILLGGLLFADSCQNVVSLSWLDYVRDLDAMGQYSWGSATLACLYRRLCHASRVSAITSGGPYLLVQLWAWERIPVIRPDVLPYFGIGDFPRGGRWAAERTGVDPYSRSTTSYREQLALLRLDQFIWMPYSDGVLASLPDYCRRGERIWRARVPLIFWHIVEIHCPDRVMRQFGMGQEIPEEVDTNRGLHQLEISGYPGRNWAHFHRDWIGYWNARGESQVPGVPTTTFRPSNNYLEWYHNHTVLYITPPIQQQTQVGQMLHGVSGQLEYLMNTMQRIGRQSHDAFELDDPGNRFHPRLATIVDGAYGSMQYLQRFDRMVVGDYDPFDHNPHVTPEIPIQPRVRRVPTQGGPSSSRSRRHRHGLQDEVIEETGIQMTEGGTQSHYNPTSNQFTTSVSVPMTDIHGVSHGQNISPFTPQVTSFPHSQHIALDATPLPQFPPFGVYSRPSPYLPVFGGHFPSSSNEPPLGYVATAADSSSTANLHPIFNFLNETGGVPSISDLPDYYSLGQTTTVPASIHPISTTTYGQTGDFATYRSQHDGDSSTTVESDEEDDVGPYALRDRCRRKPKRFCCPSTTPGDKGKGKRRTNR